MSIDIYKHIYNKIAYQRPCKQNNYRISIANFNVDKYDSITSKYDDVKLVIHSKWLHNAYDEQVISNLHITNKVYFGLLKLYNIISMKYNKRYDYDFDICGNPLSSLTNRCKISIIENNTEYIFRISDLIKIINDSLSTSDNFFLQPTDVKNPYTNGKFSISNLYNIYFRIKFSDYKMPILFHYFFLCDFDKQIFRIRYNYEIKEFILLNKCDQLTTPQMKSSIMKMLKKCKTVFKSMSIHKDFPEKILIQALFPFYKLYYRLCHTSNTISFYSTKDFFIKKCILFDKVNYLFGRCILKKQDKIYQNYMCTEFTPFEELDVSTVTKRELKRHSMDIFEFDEFSDDSDESDESESEESDDEFDDVEIIIVQEENLNRETVQYPQQLSQEEYELSVCIPETQPNMHLEILNNMITREVLDNIISSIEQNLT